IALARPDREPDADLARALGDRDEHDVHDPDAADEQADRGDGGEENRESTRRLLHHLIDLGDVVDLEIDGRRRRQMPALAHQLGHVADHLRYVFGPARCDPDESHIRVAGDAALQRADRHDHDIVLILAEGGLAFGLEHAHDLAGRIADADIGADGVLAAEQRAAYGLSHDAHGAASADLRLGEQASLRYSPIAGGEIGVVRAHDLRRMILVAGDDDLGADRNRSHRAYIGDLTD